MATLIDLDSRIVVEELTKFRSGDLEDICDAADTAIREGGGFGWIDPPTRDVMERYWRGVLVVPERHLFIARLDGVIAGSAQMIRPARNSEAHAHACTLTTSFVAPWARGHHIALRLTMAIEDAARQAGFRVINLDVRETQDAAIAVYESLGFKRWGCHPNYALVRGKVVAGYYYSKILTDHLAPTENSTDASS